MTKVSSLESSLALDARLVKLTADLDAERTRASSLAGKLALAREESSTFQRRMQQLEKGGETTAEMEMKRQRQQYNEAVSRLEGQVSGLEQVRPSLALPFAELPLDLVLTLTYTSRRTSST